MASYRAPPTPTDRVKAIAAVAAVHIAMVATLMLGGKTTDPARDGQPPTQLIDVVLPPPPPPPLPPEPKASPQREAGAAGMEAQPVPIVNSPPKIVLPPLNPIATAPIAGVGNAASAGAANAGTGLGASGAGDGRGGGGAGTGLEIGSDVRLLGGHRSKLPARLLRQMTTDRGNAQLWLAISQTGRVSDCGVISSTGNGQVDQALCDLMIRQSRWEAARDLQGRPIAVKIPYNASWRKD